MNAQEYWQVAYNQFELQFDRGTFNTWMRGAFLMQTEGNVYVVGVRNEYARDMLQTRLYREVCRILSDVVGKPIEMRFEVARPPKKQRADYDMPLFRLLDDPDEKPSIPPADDTAQREQPLHERITRPERPAVPDSEINPRFTFDRFMVDGSNRITYEAARAVAESPGHLYNPFMIYGGVGLGKTHLLQAIANSCQSRGLRVIYIPSEAFTNDLIDSIRHKTTAMFREKYRSADVLLVDDVQFISGKDSTQEEFFHTFNALYTYNKQIVLASDRHPRELSTLEDRLRSRFEGGLVSDVQTLDFESRVAILKMWCQERKVKLEPTVLSMMAERGSGNVRELEGVYNQIIAQTQLSRGPLTLKNAEFTLERYDSPREHGLQRQRVTTKQVIETTACHFQLKVSDLTSKRRAARINKARQVAMYLVRELTESSLPQIGEAFGGRSHTTVLHGCNKIAEELDFDSGLRERLSAIRTMLEDGTS